MSLTDYDESGLYAARPGSISTWHGRIDPLHPDPGEIDIDDIAHSLARLCRYNGHVEGYLSVARHSIWVAEHLANQHHEPVVILQGLLHDGAEAYLSDIPRPVKRAPELAVFREIDSQMDECVMTAFRLPFPIPDVVMDADRSVLLDVEMAHPDGARHTWNSTPEQDEADFLRLYHSLRRLVNGAKDEIPVFGAAAVQPARLIGLSGYAQSGKDTAARVLMEHFNFTRVAFADKLRQMALALNPWVSVGYGGSVVRLADIVGQVGWEVAKTQHPDVRELLQRLGTEAGRNVLGQNVWVDAAMSAVQEGGRYVFTDVRFPNEWEAIKDAGGEVWRVVRPGVDPINPHPSETALDEYPFAEFIHNDAGLLEFDRSVHMAAARTFARR